MSKPVNTQSQKRFEESFASLFTEYSQGTKRALFLKSSSDEGVIRNGGRNGARLAPRSLLATLKRFTLSEALRAWTCTEVEVSDCEEEKKDFSRAQSEEAGRIQVQLQSAPDAVVHIGGGHDHIFPFLKALSASYTQIIVINVDAHADTRTDAEAHSGTPFRQFAGESTGKFHLFQVGLHPYANSFSTLTPLPAGQTTVLWRQEIPSRQKAFFDQIKDLVDENTAVVFSLDADALGAGQVPGVSAVNADGLSLQELTSLWQEYIGLKGAHPLLLGVYELNPVYDTLASLSMRTIGAFIFQGLHQG